MYFVSIAYFRLNKCYVFYLGNFRISKYLSNAQFPKLRKLSLEASSKELLKIDFAQFSNTLEELILKNQDISDITSLSSLTKLRVLSLTKVWADYNGHFLEILRSLKQLRYILNIN